MHTKIKLKTRNKVFCFPSLLSPFGAFVLIGGFFLFLFASCPKSEPVDGPAARAGTDWPVFRGTAGLTGVTDERLPDTLAPAFTIKTGGEGISSSPVIGDGVLFYASLDGTLAAVNLETRAKLWEFIVPDGFEAPPLYVPEERLVIAGGLDGVVCALEAGTGKPKWKAETGARIMGSANICRPRGGRALVIAGSYDNFLYGFDLETGRRAWAIETGNYLNGAPAVDPPSARAVIGGCDARLHVIDGAAGRETAAVDTGAYIAGSAALEGGTAYVGNYGGRFLAVDTGKPGIIWSFELTEKERGFIASPAVTDQYVVIGAKDASLYCLRRADGRPVWTYRARAEYQSSCLVGGDRVLAAASDGELVLLDLASGRLLFRYELGAEVKASPAFAAGVIAVAALDGNIYVFKAKGEEMAP